MKVSRLFRKALWEQFLIALIHGDSHYPSVLLFDYWKSYVGSDNKTYYDNWGILKAYLTKC